MRSQSDGELTGERRPRGGFWQRLTGERAHFRIWRRGPRARPVVGVALGGGGARGWAHVGVLKVLREAGIPIDLVVGTSMGGAIGVLWAAHGDPDVLCRLALEHDPGRLFASDRTRHAIVDSGPVSLAIERAAGHAHLEDLPVRCAVVATDIHAGRAVVLDRGPIHRAVQATIAIPGVFSPVAVDGALLVDGGIVNPVPADVALAQGADCVIAVNVCADPTRPLVRPKRSPTPLARRLAPFFLTFGLARRLAALEVWIKSTEVCVATLAHAQLAHLPNTVVVRPEVGHYRSDEFDRHAECVALGEVAARRALPQIQALLRGARRSA